MNEIKSGDLVNIINQDGELDGPFIFLEGPIRPYESKWSLEDEESKFISNEYKKSLWHYLVMNNNSPKWLECGFNTLIKLESSDAEKS